MNLGRINRIRAAARRHLQLAILFIAKLRDTFYPSHDVAVVVVVGCVRTKNQSVRLRFAPAAKPPIGLQCGGRPESIEVLLDVEAGLLTEDGRSTGGVGDETSKGDRGSSRGPA
jgi:hypothetical protein